MNPQINSPFYCPVHKEQNRSNHRHKCTVAGCNRTIKVQCPHCKCPFAQGRSHRDHSLKCGKKNLVPPITLEVLPPLVVPLPLQPPIDNLPPQPLVDNLPPQPPVDNLPPQPPIDNLPPQPPIDNLPPQPPVDNLPPQPPFVLSPPPVIENDDDDIIILEIFVVEGPWNGNAAGSNYGKLVEAAFTNRGDLNGNVEVNKFYFSDKDTFVNIIDNLEPSTSSIVVIAGDANENGIEYYIDEEQNFIPFELAISTLEKNELLNQYCFLVHFGACYIGKKIKKIKTAPWIISGYDSDVDWSSSISFELALFYECVSNDNIDAKSVSDIGKKFKNILRGDRKNGPKFICK